MLIRFFFDAGSGVCLWAGDDASNERHGFAINTGDLPISSNTCYWLQHLIAWYDTSLDWNDPAGDSLWSGEEEARFRLAVQEGVRRLQQELAPAGYEICDESCTAEVDYPPQELLARVFMPAASPAEADAHNQALQAALAAFSPESRHRPEAYWKIPGWYEHFFALRPADQASFDAVVALSDGAWKVTRDGECDAVWNSSPGHSFLLPAVTWAEILLIYPNPPDPDEEYLPL